VKATDAAKNESSTLASKHSIAAFLSLGLVENCASISAEELALRGINKHFALLLKVCPLLMLRLLQMGNGRRIFRREFPIQMNSLLRSRSSGTRLTSKA